MPSKKRTRDKANDDNADDNKAKEEKRARERRELLEEFACVICQDPCKQVALGFCPSGLHSYCNGCAFAMRSNKCAMCERPVTGVWCPSQVQVRCMEGEPMKCPYGCGYTIPWSKECSDGMNSHLSRDCTATELPIDCTCCATKCLSLAAFERHYEREHGIEPHVTVKYGEPRDFAAGDLLRLPRAECAAGETKREVALLPVVSAMQGVPLPKEVPSYVLLETAQDANGGLSINVRGVGGQSDRVYVDAHAVITDHRGEQCAVNSSKPMKTHSALLQLPDKSERTAHSLVLSTPGPLKYAGGAFFVYLKLRRRA